jgi:multidrug resistance efflux pump
MFSFSFAGVLAVLVFLNVAPNILSGSSRRAMVNAPVTLVTSPIAGRLMTEQAGSGQRVRAGDVIARVENLTVDRSELMRLKLESLSVGEKLLVVKTQLNESRPRAEELRSRIASLKSAALIQLEESTAQARAKLEAARAVADARLSHSARIRPLLLSNTYTRFHLEAAAFQAAEAAADKSAAEHLLTSRIALLDAGKHDVFVGDSFVLLTSLQQQLMTIDTEMKKLEAEQLASEERSKALKDLVEAEEDRIKKLGESAVVASTDGYVLDIDRRPGQYVDAGSKILRTASCKTAIVTAVFPISMVSDLTSEAPVAIDLIEDGRRLNGRVARIMPRDAERESERLWVPLPPALTNEMYALISLDEPLSQDGDSNDCKIGGWVRVTFESRLIGHMSAAISQTFASASHVLASVSQALASVGDLIVPPAHTEELIQPARSDDHDDIRAGDILRRSGAEVDHALAD